MKINKNKSKIVGDFTYSLLSAFYYIRTSEYMRTLCNELKQRLSRVPCTCSDDGDIIFSALVVAFGDYGVSPRAGWIPDEIVSYINIEICDFIRFSIDTVDEEDEDVYKDGPFTLTDGDHYFVLMAEHKYNDESDLVEYSGMHHSTKESARMELAYAQGDDWGNYIKSIEIKEVGE